MMVVHCYHCHGISYFLWITSVRHYASNIYSSYVFDTLTLAGERVLSPQYSGGKSNTRTTLFGLKFRASILLPIYLPLPPLLSPLVKANGLNPLTQVCPRFSYIQAIAYIQLSPKYISSYPTCQGLPCAPRMNSMPPPLWSFPGSLPPLTREVTSSCPGTHHHPFQGFPLPLKLEALRGHETCLMDYDRWQYWNP